MSYPVVSKQNCLWSETVSNSLKAMSDACQNAPAVLEDIKNRTSGKMVGYFSPVVPEELIAAAGFHPIRIYPKMLSPITAADDHLQPYVCSYVRAAWGQIVQGKHSYLDGVIIPRSCEAVTFLYQTWKRHLAHEFVDYLNVPWKRTEHTIGFFKKELERVQKHLEAFSGKRISTDVLNTAIRRYNQHRELMRRVYDLRAAEHPPVSGLDVFHMVMSSFILPKERHMELLAQWLHKLGDAPASKGPRPRLLISGGCVIDGDLWELIESCGAVIVADDVNNGARSFWQDVPGTGDPLDSLARTYTQAPCGFNTTISDRFAFLSELIKRYCVQGVIFAINKRCESEAFDYPELEKRIRERLGKPTLLVETDYLNQIERLRTPIEAFVEMLKEDERPEARGG